VTPPQYPPVTPPKYPPKTPPPPPFKKTRKEKDFMFKAYRVQIRRGGKFKDIGARLPYGRALRFGSERTKRTLAATFRLVPEGFTSQQDVQFTPSKRVFRDYTVKQGRPVKLDLTFIQRSRTRLETGGERGEIRAARSGIMARRSGFGF